MTDLEFKTNNSKIVQGIEQAIDLFSDDWKTTYGLFLHTEYLTRFVEFSRAGFKSGFPVYSITSEYKTQIDCNSIVIKELSALFLELEHCNFKWTRTLQFKAQQCIEYHPFSEILLLMGQRLSSTSLRNIDALPPMRNTLLNACFTPFNTHMSIVVRAWEKHAERTEDEFWPKREGNAAYKETMMREFVEQFLEHWEWWNVYSHQKHGYVFELRIQSGHGMRWTKNGKQFIGFLEPFIEHKE